MLPAPNLMPRPCSFGRAIRLLHKRTVMNPAKDEVVIAIVAAVLDRPSVSVMYPLPAHLHKKAEVSL